jgi:hypothetical protein
MTERRLVIPRLRGEQLVLDEYELHESPTRPGCGKAKYLRSHSARAAQVDWLVALHARPVKLAGWA